ncbi:MAG: type II toxin-antitoxin system RelB/DinJ family antitoxin [Firmicutes bacterium]|jgi:DNA-damage-inducible protein J|nr:type II toxin-antitoxin system RelB/DinJ family antitoxin [Bacillota bacterium]
MAQTNINIRMDEELKKNFDMICTELGLNMTAAINVFARAVVRKHGIPFDLTINDDFFYSEANLERLRKSIASLEAGKGTVHELIEADDE